MVMNNRGWSTRGGVAAIGVGGSGLWMLCEGGGRGRGAGLIKGALSCIGGNGLGGDCVGVCVVGGWVDCCLLQGR